MRKTILAVLALAMLTAPLALGASYVGSKKCKMCHIKQYKSWEATKMAQAFEVLKVGSAADAKTKAGLDPEKDYTTDSQCLKCHATGYGQPGGFTNIEETPHLAGVGCEMCHGAGSEYLKSGKMTNTNKEFKKADLVSVGLVSPPTQESCMVCHNQESPFVGEGYEFDFEAKKAEGTHDHFPLKYSHE